MTFFYTRRRRYPNRAYTYETNAPLFFLQFLYGLEARQRRHPMPELDVAELRRSAAENTWDDLFDENVNLRAELDALTARAEQAEAQNTRLQQLLANLAIGIGAADGFGYRAKHGLAVVQELFETVDAEILKQAEQVSQGEV